MLGLSFPGDFDAEGLQSRRGFGTAKVSPHLCFSKGGQPYYNEQYFGQGTFSLLIDIVSMSSVLQVLREFCINPEQVHYFMHDSAAYMEPAATRLRKDKGYKNMVSLPCWAHILSRIGEVVTDVDSFDELREYLRLTRLLFARYILLLFPLCGINFSQESMVASHVGSISGQGMGRVQQGLSAFFLLAALCVIRS